MTLSPVFRSMQAVSMLEKRGIWIRLRPAMAAQARAVETIYEDLANVLGERFRQTPKPIPPIQGARSDEELEFLQEYFFLILFRALFESLGIAPERLAFYTELNFCIKGTITAADNLFDGQDKCLLPLKGHCGARYRSILQLMSFERLIQRVCRRAAERGAVDRPGGDAALRGLLDLMAEIGELEGTEENGVEEIPDPQTMIEQVHRVRGGALFALAFVAPKAIEADETLERVRRAEPAIARLGTAFQIVDDLTDFEFDLERRSHNLLISQIAHRGSAAEKEHLAALRGGQKPAPGSVEGIFRDSARNVLEAARKEARAAFEALEEIGFWFPAKLSDEVVRAIVGLDGVARMEALTA